MSVTIAVDANGADLGPAEVAAGAAIAARQGVRVVLFGPAEAFGEVPDGIEVVDAPVSIAKAADPVRASRARPDASIVLAARAVAEGDADAFVSGGSTGPALAAGLFNIQRAPGIHRPALAIPVPVPGHAVTIVDVGANVEVRPEHLVQFGFMGAALAQVVLGVERPRVGLLSIGEEHTKGTPLVIEAHAALRDRLAEGDTFDFVGNVEGNEVAGRQGRRRRHRRLHRQRRPQADGGRVGGDAAPDPRRGVDVAARQGRRDAAAPRAARVPRGHRSRERRRRVPPRAAPAGGRPARALQPPRDRPGDPARGARRGGDVVGRTHAALDAARALRTAPLSGRRSTVASP